MKLTTRKFSKHRQKKVTGFTLVEMLVAIAITVVVATIAYSLFHQSADAIKQSSDVFNEVNQLETVWQILNNDLNHAINRVPPPPAAGVSASAVGAFIGGEAARDSARIYDGEYVLRLVRDGWSNPLELQRSDLQRVGYRWLEGSLWRDYWSEKNQPLDEEPLGRRLLLTGLKEIHVRFLPMGASAVVSNDWLETWPAPGGGSQVPGLGGVTGSRPVAMEVTLNLENIGEIQRIFSFAN
jgi:general secretion pathway protein J